MPSNRPVEESGKGDNGSKKLRFDETHSIEEDIVSRRVEKPKNNNLSCIKHFSIYELACQFVDDIIDRSAGQCEFYVKQSKEVCVEGISFDTNETQAPPTETSCLDLTQISPSITINWPKTGDFDVDAAISTIEDYISLWQLKENWKHVIKLIKSESDQLSDIYKFDAMFSIPTKLYPIPQATASVYFTMEVSRVCPEDCPVDVYYNLEANRQKFSPGQFVFQESWLNNIVDAKIKFYQTLRF